MQVTHRPNPQPGCLDRGLIEMPLEELAQAARVESAKFLEGKPNVEIFALEVFRRAVCHSDQEAWALLFQLYRGLLISQLSRHSARNEVLEDPEFWVNGAFERFWTAVGPDRFSLFPDLAAILKYLKMCLHSVIMDELRARQRTRHESLDTAVFAGPTQAPPEDAVLGGMAGAELWDAIVRQLNDEKEYIVASLSFVRGMKPNQIHAQHPEQFVDVADVYRLKHSIVERLRRRYQLSRDGWTGTHAAANCKARQRS
jgi:DNA-directed RNA polymerase specialized sigma24 family protein